MPSKRKRFKSKKISHPTDRWTWKKGWVVVLRTTNLPDMKSQIYMSRELAERAAAERVMAHPELIGRISVERGEEKL